MSRSIILKRMPGYQPLHQRCNQLVSAQLRAPALWDRAYAIANADDAAGNTCGGIRVVTQADRGLDYLLIAVGLQRPACRVQAIDDVAAAVSLRRIVGANGPF